MLLGEGMGALARNQGHHGTEAPGVVGECGEP